MEHMSSPWFWPQVWAGLKYIYRKKMVEGCNPTVSGCGGVHGYNIFCDWHQINLCKKEKKATITFPFNQAEFWFPYFMLQQAPFFDTAWKNKSQKSALIPKISRVSLACLKFEMILTFACWNFWWTIGAFTFKQKHPIPPTKRNQYTVETLKRSRSPLPTIHCSERFSNTTDGDCSLKGKKKYKQHRNEAINALSNWFALENVWCFAFDCMNSDLMQRVQIKAGKWQK